MLTAEESAYLQGMSTAALQTIAAAPASQWDISPVSPQGTPGYSIGLAEQMTNPDGSTYSNLIWSFWEPLSSQDAEARPAELAAAANALIAQRAAVQHSPAVTSAVSALTSAINSAISEVDPAAAALATAMGLPAPGEIRGMMLGALRLALAQEASIFPWFLDLPLFQGAVPLSIARPGMPGFDGPP